MSIPRNFHQFNSSDHQDFGGANSDLAKGAVERARAERRAERIAKASRRPERPRPLALMGRDDLDAMYTAPPPPAPVEHKETAKELHDRAVAQMEIVKAELADLAKALGRTA
jgi:hypothetical protein